MPYDPRKDGMRETARGTSIPHVSYHTPVADAPVQPRKRRRSQPSPKAASVTRAAETVSTSPAALTSSTALRRTPRRRRRQFRVPWRPVLTVVAVLPAIVAVGLAVYYVATLPPRPDPTPVAEAPVVYVTATFPPNLVLTATSILPPGYIESLSQTPGSLFATPELTPPTVTPAFEAATSEATPVFSIASTKIVYVCNVGEHNGGDEICIMNADGSNQRQLTFLRGTDYYPSLSPDGRTVVFSSQRGNAPFDIYAVNAVGGDVWQITDDPCQDMAPEFSPDGSRIVFTSTRNSGGTCGDQNIWIMNADGSNQIQLTHVTSIDPSWSPDGQFISFTSNRRGVNDLYMMNADGSNVRQVTNGMGVGGRNDWSADGGWLAFYAGPEGDKDIYLVPIECSLMEIGCSRPLIRRLTDGGNNKGPSFSPDGQWITFTSGHEQGNEILIMRVDGSEMIALTSNNLSDWMPRWGW